MYSAAYLAQIHFSPYVSRGSFCQQSSAPPSGQDVEKGTAYQIYLVFNTLEGFYRFAALLEQLAEGIADGRIPVPE
jgi:hypothetical protein